MLIQNNDIQTNARVEVTPADAIEPQISSDSQGYIIESIKDILLPIQGAIILYIQAYMNLRLLTGVFGAFSFLVDALTNKVSGILSIT